MKEQIDSIINQYYNGNVPEIKDLVVLHESLELGIVCIRWRDEKSTVTIKSILQDKNLLLIQLT